MEDGALQERLCAIKAKVSHELGYSNIPTYFYCDKLSYFDLEERISSNFANVVTISGRFDHILITCSEGLPKHILLIFAAHSSGLCQWLHPGEQSFLRLFFFESNQKSSIQNLKLFYLHHFSCTSFFSRITIVATHQQVRNIFFASAHAHFFSQQISAMIPAFFQVLKDIFSHLLRILTSCIC